MLNISNIQHFSVGDGSGIRTTVFFKGCNLCCPWCHNPENLSPQPVRLDYRSVKKTELIGRCISVDDILPELLEDKDFYIASGGGVTFSGGEVMLQAKSAAELARKLKENGVTVIVDTAGCVPYSNFTLLNGIVDGYLFDFKTADSEKYRQIGGDLSLVTENVKRLIGDGASLTVRVPLIPDFNIDSEDSYGICEYLCNIGIKEVELLPFHRLGSAKYEAMGLIYAYGDTEPLSKEEILNIEQIYSKYFKVKIER